DGSALFKLWPGGSEFLLFAGVFPGWRKFSFRYVSGGGSIAGGEQKCGGGGMLAGNKEGKGIFSSERRFF
ncbi:hypothetical protein, partial [Akkermansia sp.]|uniref:hypothetical protein n=1 Tax=Akkermansia sp. TaxID=1872421 RepID=UPI0039945062